MSDARLSVFLAGAAGSWGTQVWCWRYPAVRPPAQAWLRTASPCHPVSHGWQRPQQDTQHRGRQGVWWRVWNVRGHVTALCVCVCVCVRACVPACFRPLYRRHVQDVGCMTRWRSLASSPQEVCVFRPAVHYGCEVRHRCVTTDGEKVPGHSQREQVSPLLLDFLHYSAQCIGRQQSQLNLNWILTHHMDLQFITKRLQFEYKAHHFLFFFRD